MAPAELTARRAGAFAVNALVFLVVAVLAGRLLTDLQQETVPAAFRDAPIDLCDVVASAGHGSTSICFRMGDTLVSSTTSHAPLRIAVAAMAAAILNSVVLAHRRGASLGMRMLGVRVVRRDTGALAGPDQLALRWAAWAIDGTGIGALVFVLARGRRRAGDLLAGTVVVAQDAVGRPPVLAPPVLRLRPARTSGDEGCDAAAQPTAPEPAGVPLRLDAAAPPHPLT